MAFVLNKKAEHREVFFTQQNAEQGTHTHTARDLLSAIAICKMISDYMHTANFQGNKINPSRVMLKQEGIPFCNVGYGHKNNHRLANWQSLLLRSSGVSS